MAFAELWNLVQEMPLDKICDLLPRPVAPTDGHIRLRFLQIKPVLEHLHQADAPANAPLDPVSPQKLEYNQLPVLVIDFLQRGRRLSSVVDEYFRKHHDPELADRIATEFRARYASLREQKLKASQIFAELFEFSGGYDPMFKSIESQAAVAAVLAYFFDRCDFFENVAT
jgi:hypothetical protein